MVPAEHTIASLTALPDHNRRMQAMIDDMYQLADSVRFLGWYSLAKRLELYVKWLEELRFDNVILPLKQGYDPDTKAMYILYRGSSVMVSQFIKTLKLNARTFREHRKRGTLEFFLQKHRMNANPRLSNEEITDLVKQINFALKEKQMANKEACND